jgi:hypothetical protein
MEKPKPIYEEKQYLGSNRLSLLRRLLLALFCFAVYWWRIRNDHNGDLLFWLGIGIVVISMLMMLVLHVHIRIYRDHIILDGLWSARKVKIDLGKIKTIERVRYSKYHLNNPVFNLHLKGKIRFYTGGTDAIELNDGDGLSYVIGTQRPEDLERVLKQTLSNNQLVIPNL